jgi:hypothetical protein
MPQVPRRLGRRTRRLAHVSHRPDDETPVARLPLRAARAAGGGGGRLCSAVDREHARRAPRARDPPRAARGRTERVPQLVAALSALDDDRCVLEPTADWLGGLAVYVAAIGVEFGIVDSPAFAEEVGRLAERFVRATKT